MLSPGEAAVTVTPLRDPGQAGQRAPVRPAADLLHEARARERAACITEAVAAYEATIAVAEIAGEQAVLAEALRRLAVVRHRRAESVGARELCLRSHAVARRAGNGVLAGEALNTLGGIDLETDAVAQARQHFLRALELGGQSRELRARVEQNLGVLANIQGDVDEALARYGRSLEAYRASNDEHGCAIAYHNLGMASADRQQFDEAERYFRQSYEIAERASDLHLQGLCLVNHADVHLVRERYEDARRNAETALALFDQLDARSDKADAYRVLGMVFRETGRPALAEARLRSAIEQAMSSDAVLNGAEASRELALLYQSMGRNQEALTLLNDAHRLFRRLNARVDLVHVDGKLAELEATYLAVVREWGQSIESSDPYTFGHCERVGRHAVAVACALGGARGDRALPGYVVGGGLRRLPRRAGPATGLTSGGCRQRGAPRLLASHRLRVGGARHLAPPAESWNLRRHADRRFPPAPFRPHGRAPRPRGAGLRAPQRLRGRLLRHP